MSIVIFFSPSSNTPVFGGVERGHVKETEADHGHRGPDGERSDEPEEEAQQPSVTNHQLEYRGHTDGALNLSDSLLAMVVVLIYYVQPGRGETVYLPHLQPGFLVNLSPGLVILQRRTLPGPLVQGQDCQGRSDEGEGSALDYWEAATNDGLEESHDAGDKKYGGDYVAASWVVISEEMFCYTFVFNLY